jgi:hypothetical protein
MQTRIVCRNELVVAAEDFDLEKERDTNWSGNFFWGGEVLLDARSRTATGHFNRTNQVFVAGSTRRRYPPADCA